MPHSTLTPLITKGTHFIESFPAHALEYAPDIGFVTLPDDELKDSQAHVLGYQALADSDEPPLYSRSLTTLAELPLAARTRSGQGQGVGARLYNTPYAVAAFAGYVGHIGAYVATINLERMHVQQNALEDTAVRGLSRILHSGSRQFRSVMTHLTPLDRIVDRAHQSYGEAETVRFSDDSSCIISPVPHHFLLVRNPKLILHGVGHIRTAAGE
jgi:GNAT superfamily N-acetyltransferase